MSSGTSAESWAGVPELRWVVLQQLYARTRERLRAT